MTESAPARDGLPDLLRRRIVVAPMAGGPTTAGLVIAAALADPRYTATTVTRAFSGRPARGLVNELIIEHADAPPAYPEINNATRPLRAAAAARGDTERMSLWAGQGYRLAAELPAAEIIDRLRG